MLWGSVVNIKDTPFAGAGTTVQRAYAINGGLWVNLDDPAAPYMERYDADTNTWIPLEATDPTLPAWALGGNTGANHVLGTTDANGFRVIVAGVDIIDMYANGKVGIGTLGAVLGAEKVKIIGNIFVTASGIGTNTFNASTNLLQANTNDLQGITTLSSVAAGSDRILAITNAVGNTQVSFISARINSVFTRTSGTKDDGLMRLNPTLNYSAGTHTFIAFAYEPTLTNITALTSHIFLRTTAGNIQLCEVSGSVSIGTAAPMASAKLDVSSTTQGFAPPRMTTTQRDAIAAPGAGIMIFNTTTSKHQGYDGATWNDFY